jgi:Na+/H+-dicarboxylate symporter
MAALLSRIGIDIFIVLGCYMVFILIGLLPLLIFYMGLLLIIGENLLTFLRAIRETQLLAFSTSGSATVMSISMKKADEKLGVSSNISDFIIPIGATINMDGTAMSQCATTLFIAQAYGIELSVMNLLLITFTAIVASIGTPANPGGGIIIFASVLQSVGIPMDGLIVIIGLDPILGMSKQPSM